MVLMRSGISGNSLPGRSSQQLLLSRPLSRRRLLALGLATAAVSGLTGCRSQTVAAPIPLEPDELAVNRAVSAATALRTDALALATAKPDLAVLLNRMVAVHEQHLAALGSPIPALSPSATSSGPASTANPAPDTAPTPTRLVKAELAAAQTALRDGEAAAPAFAVLLCRIAAARVINADLLGAAIGRAPSGVLRPAPTDSSVAPSATDRGTSTAAEPDTTDSTAAVDPSDLTDQHDLSEPSTPAQVALNRLLAGEHAAVFAYPLVVARTSGTRRSLAGTLWQAHRTERDQLSVRLLTARIQPAVAEPAYDVGIPPTSSTKAAALAARVERGLAALAAELLAAGTAGDDDRALGADQLILAARRMAGWTGKPAAFPGLIERSTSAATPTDGDSLGTPATASNSSFIPPGTLSTAQPLPTAKPLTSVNPLFGAPNSASNAGFTAP